jgi:hypothetical protein
MKPGKAALQADGMVLRREPKRLAHRAAARTRHDADDRRRLDEIDEALEDETPDEGDPSNRIGHN